MPNYLETSLIVETCRREIEADSNLNKLPEPFYMAAVETLARRRIAEQELIKAEVDGEMEFNANKRRRD